MSIVYDCTEARGRTSGIAAGATALRGGRLVVMPTDTLYGIGCDAFDREAVASLLHAKGRGPDMPVPVLVGSWHTIDGLTTGVTAEARRLIRAFWPGALSLVVRQAPSLHWDLGRTDGTVMLRMPLHPVALDLIREVGPLAVSSANISGRPPAARVDEAREQLAGSVAVYLDGGDCPVGAPSTIVDVSGPVPRVRREGAIPLVDIARVCGVDEATLRG